MTTVTKGRAAVAIKRTAVGSKWCGQRRDRGEQARSPHASGRRRVGLPPRATVAAVHQRFVERREGDNGVPRRDE